MKLTIIFPKRQGSELQASIIPSDKASNTVVLQQINGLGQIKNVIMTYKEADALREWLNINLPR